MNKYKTTYKRESVAGEIGWTYIVSCSGRVVFEGWSRGAKREAQVEVRNGIINREALLGCVAAKAAA